MTTRLRPLAFWLTATLVAALAECSSAPAEPKYLLPWAAGEANRHLVIQGNFSADNQQHCLTGCSTHNDNSMRYAWDFALPEGTEVLAARAGTVALENGSWNADHCGGVSAGQTGSVNSPLVGNETNFVEIDHGDGTAALYLHLSSVSADIERKAKTGKLVAQGEVLGLSGKTGYTQCVPHLHFQVEQSVKADWFTTSIPVSFSDADVINRSADGLPIEGGSYASDNIRISEGH